MKCTFSGVKAVCCLALDGAVALERRATARCSCIGSIMKTKRVCLAVAALLCGWSMSAMGAVGASSAVSYPKPIHGIWFNRNADGRAQCANFRKDKDETKLTDAMVITPAKWMDISNGEGSYSTPVKVRKIGLRHWRFNERFHLQGDVEFTETQTVVHIPLRGSMKETYQYTDAGVIKKATQYHFKCL